MPLLFIMGKRIHMSNELSKRIQGKIDATLEGSRCPYEGHLK